MSWRLGIRQHADSQAGFSVNLYTDIDPLPELRLLSLPSLQPFTKGFPCLCHTQFAERTFPKRLREERSFFERMERNITQVGIGANLFSGLVAFGSICSSSSNHQLKIEPTSTRLSNRSYRDRARNIQTIRQTVTMVFNTESGKSPSKRVKSNIADENKNDE